MELVDDVPGLAALARHFSGTRTFFIDTEFDSRKSGTTLSLIQLSDGGEPHLIDALALRDLSPLAKVLGRDDAVWVLHAGLQDVELLVERLDLEAPPHLFDTQVAWALLGPEASVSLAYLEYRLLGIRKAKAHQADDWIRRPLPASQLSYAAEDIEHLPELKRLLVERIDALERMAIVEAACREQLLPSPEADIPVTLDSFRNAWQLGKESQAALVFMIEWQRSLSARERRYGLSSKSFLSVASRLPRDDRDLARIKGVPARWAREHGRDFVKRMREAVHRASDADYVPIDPAPYATFDDYRLDAWLQTMRAKVCESVSVAPELALNSRLIKRIRAEIKAHDDDRARGVDALTGWRNDLLEAPYRAFCESH